MSRHFITEMADYTDTEVKAPQGVSSFEEDETSRLPEVGREASEATPVLHEEVAEVGNSGYRAGNGTDERGEHPSTPESLHCDSQESSIVKQGEELQGEYFPDRSEATETIFREGQIEIEEQTTEHVRSETLEPQSQATWFTDCRADDHLNVQEGKEMVKGDHEDDKKEESEADKCLGDEVTRYLTKTEALNIKSEREDNYLEMEQSTTCQEAPTVSSDTLTIQDPTATEDNPTLFQEEPTAPEDDPTITQEVPTISPEVLLTQDPTATEDNPTLFQDPTIHQDEHAIFHKPEDDTNTQNPMAMEDSPTTCQEGNTDTTEVDSISLENAQQEGTTFSPPEGTEENTQPLGGEPQHSEDHNTTAEGTTKDPSSLDIATELSGSSSQHVPEIQGSPAELQPSSESTKDVLLGDSKQQELHSVSEQEQQDGVGEEPGEVHQSCNCLHAEGDATVKCCEMKCVGSSETQNEESMSSKDAEGLQSTEVPMEEKDGSEM
ncbi:nestin-like isoform X2 [Microcaecilia unicolor]|uniref:Nestin-like isoform X2 n=1 Tax=Microcaecilia unicolor TaxID=1415580 RepID=A0A6P7XKI3_9AMPH|nr:nestin-like isoform X2 [Microcaecilia unicolor]